MRPVLAATAVAAALAAVFAAIALPASAVAGCTPTGKAPLPFIALQGSAFLLPFYQGAMQGLADAGALGPATRLAGLSGGAITAALSASGLSGERQFNATTAVLAACRAGDPAGCSPLNGKLASLLADLLPPDAPARAGERVRVWVSALPNVSAPTLAGSVPLGLTGFTSMDDLTSALFGSDMIPCFSEADRQYNLVRGGVPAIDGGFSSDFRELCADAASAGAPCLTIATAVVNGSATADGGADLAGCPAAVGDGYKAAPAAAARAGRAGTSPLPPPTLPRSKWSLPTACPPAPADVAQLWPPFVPHGATLQAGTKPDIYPGARTAALAAGPGGSGGGGWTGCQWLGFALKPDWDKWQSVYEAGLAEAGAWAVAHGYCVEGGPREGVAAPEKRA